MLTAQVFIDFAFCLGLLTMLVTCYGSLRRKLPGTTLAPQLLGLTFGGVAALMMYVPLPLADGVIIDLRVIPVVLAGAFLGLRGTLIAALVATAMRLGVGGVGWFSGLASIWSAAAIGLVWSYVTMGPAHRSRRSIAVLGAASCLTPATAIFLPSEVALRFLVGTAPLLVLVYLVMVPLLAYLLEHQRVAMQREAWDREEARVQAESTFDGPELLARGLALAENAGRFAKGAAVMSLRVRSGRLALSLWGADVEIAVLRDLRDRLEAHLPPGSEMGMITHGTILVFLEQDAVSDLRHEIAALCEAASHAPFEVPGMASVRLRLDGTGSRFDALPTYRDISRAFDPSGRASKPADATTECAPPSGISRLFKTADRLLEVREVDRIVGLNGPRPG